MEQISRKSYSQWKKLQRKKKKAKLLKMLRCWTFCFHSHQTCERAQTRWSEPPGQRETTPEARGVPLSLAERTEQPGQAMSSDTKVFWHVLPRLRLAWDSASLWEQVTDTLHEANNGQTSITVKRTTLESNIQASNPRTTTIY